MGEYNNRLEYFLPETSSRKAMIKPMDATPLKPHSSLRPSWLDASMLPTATVSTPTSRYML